MNSTFNRVLSGIALLLFAFVPTAFAKGPPKPKATNFSVGCLSGDTALQAAESINSDQDPAVVTASPASLWPPNHKLQNLRIGMMLAGPAANPVEVSLTVTAITDDQLAGDDAGRSGCGAPTAKQGADWAPPDININPVAATGTLQNAGDAVSIAGIKVRSERCAKLGTRTYVVSVTCCDTTNNVCDSVPEILDVTVAKSHRE